MAYTIAIANQKGGVAKTTTAHNVGVELAKNGYKVLLVENDSQGSLTISLGYEPELFIGNSICEVYDRTKNVQECIHICRENLHLIPANIDLSTLELALFKHYVLQAPNKNNQPNGWAFLLEELLHPIMSYYDYILIDCPPALSVLTLNALAASDSVLVPCKTDYLSYRGLSHLDNSIEQMQEYMRPDLKILGVIATLFDIRINDDKEMLQELKKRPDFLGVVKIQAAAKKGVLDGRAVIEREPYSDVAIAYRNITKRIIALSREESLREGS